MADRSDKETDELPIAWNMGRLERLNGRKEAKVKTVLFLCTGNYYRSRFAEELFNHHAERAGDDWIAQSRVKRDGSHSAPRRSFPATVHRRRSGQR